MKKTEHQTDHERSNVEVCPLLEQIVDVPLHVDYNASSGHKANHALQPNCRYVPLETPRFGRSMAVETVMKVHAESSIVISTVRCSIPHPTQLPSIPNHIPLIYIRR